MHFRFGKYTKFMHKIRLCSNDLSKLFKLFSPLLDVNKLLLFLVAFLKKTGQRGIKTNITNTS